MTDVNVTEDSVEIEKVGLEVQKALTAKYTAEAQQALEGALRTKGLRLREECDLTIKQMEVDFAKLREMEYRLEHARRMAVDTLAHVHRFGVETSSGFDTRISPMSVAVAIDEMSVWDRTDAGCDMEIVFNSRGGDVSAGMDLFDFILEMRGKGHHVTIVGRGEVASMAFIILQAGSKRVMGRNACALIHQISSGVVGKTGDIKDEVAYIDILEDRILDIFAERALEAGKAKTAEQPITRKVLKERWERRNWYLTATECLGYGLIDEIR